LGSARAHYNFKCLLGCPFDLPLSHAHAADEVSGPIAPRPLFAAWNAAIYVAQIEDNRLSEVVRDGAYLEATDRVAEEAWRALVQRRNLCDFAPPRAGLTRHDPEKWNRFSLATNAKRCGRRSMLKQVERRESAMADRAPADLVSLLASLR